MPELRRDPTTGKTKVITGTKSQLSQDFELLKPFRDIPLEELAKNSIAYFPSSLQKKPSVVVVTPTYHSLKLEAPPVSEGEGGLYDKQHNYGANEVLVCDKGDPFVLKHLINAFRDRARELGRFPAIHYIHAYRYYHGDDNKNNETGRFFAEIVALPDIGPTPAEEIEGTGRHYSLKERCFYCDMIGYELDMDKKHGNNHGNRLIDQNDSAIAISPFWATHPFEVHILPKRHAHDFTSSTDEELGDLSQLLKETLEAIALIANNPPYSFFVHTSPVNRGLRKYTAISESYHHHIEIHPHCKDDIFHESLYSGLGYRANPVSPEAAAFALRNRKLTQPA